MLCDFVVVGHFGNLKVGEVESNLTFIDYLVLEGRIDIYIAVCLVLLKLLS